MLLEDGTGENKRMSG